MNGELRNLLRTEAVVVTGVGKSFYVAQLGASLFQSVRSNAVAIHATDMAHGGLNFLRGPAPVLICISHSGKTHELVDLAWVARDFARVVAITGNDDSRLARASHDVLSYKIESDGSKHGTIPAASLVEQVACLNTLVCGLADELTAEELAFGHPGGNLGKVYNELRNE